MIISYILPCYLLQSSSVHKNEASSGDVNCDNSSAVGLPDPYNELSEEDRKFVDAIVDMGFSRAQVSRTVKHLGSDEKTVSCLKHVLACLKK